MLNKITAILKIPAEIFGCSSTNITNFCTADGAMYDEVYYKSFSNERGTIVLYSGGKVIATYKNATVLYSSLTSDAVWLTDAFGNEIYWQGHVLFVGR